MTPVDPERSARLNGEVKAVLCQLAVVALLWLSAPKSFFPKDLLAAAAVLSLAMGLSLHFIIRAWQHVHTEWKPSGVANYSRREWVPLPRAENGTETPPLMLRSFHAARWTGRASIAGLFVLFILRLGGWLLGAV